MNKKLLISFFMVISFSACLFAKDRAVVFFFETAEGISQKNVQKMLSSKNFGFCSRIDSSKQMSAAAAELVGTGKMEAVLTSDSDPYLPFVSAPVKINDSFSFDITKELKRFLSDYSDLAAKFLQKEKTGLFFDYYYTVPDTFKYFSKHSIRWFASKFPDETPKGVYIRDGVVVFVPYTDFPKNSKDIESWFMTKKEKIIPVYLSKEHIRDEKLMSAVIEIFKNSKYTDVVLPFEACETVLNNAKEYAVFEPPAEPRLAQKTVLKIAAAAKETEEQQGSALYENIYGEFQNMCSSAIIDGVIKNDQRSITLFDVSYSNIFKLSGKAVPDAELNKIVFDPGQPYLKQFGFKQAQDSYIIENSSGIIKSFTVRKTDKSVDFIIDADLTGADTFDIYIDMNGIQDTGCSITLKNTECFFMPENYWEYALRISENRITVYRFYVDEVTVVKNIAKTDNVISIPSDILRGNPYNWSYQVLALKDNKPVDFLDDEMEKERIKNTYPLQFKMFKCE